MRPDSTEPTELLRRLRQQLILAQVRIMELEDQRDDLVPRLSSAKEIQIATQKFADDKSDLSDRLETALARHAEALAALQLRITDLEQDRDAHVSVSAARLKESEELQSRLNASQRDLTELKAKFTDLKKSRSWRWTAWLRFLGL